MGSRCASLEKCTVSAAAIAASTHLDSPADVLAYAKSCFHNLSMDFNSPDDWIRYTIKSSRDVRCAKPKDRDLCHNTIYRVRLTAPISNPIEDYKLGPADPSFQMKQAKAFYQNTESCQSELLRVLEGCFCVEDLVMVFKHNNKDGAAWLWRGMHAGYFKWTSTERRPNGKPAVEIQGRMAGVNSVGLVHPSSTSINDDELKGGKCGSNTSKCSTESCNAPLLHGRIVGHVVGQPAAPYQALAGARINAAYRMSYDPTPAKDSPRKGEFGTTGRGTLEGIAILPCRN